MHSTSNWDDQHRKEAWKLIINASEILGIPLFPTISTAINYIHRYFEISGKLELSLFQISLLATFVASKTQETFCKADDVIDAFVRVALQRSPDQLSILGTNLESLNDIKKQNTEKFEDFRKSFLDSELDFMTALKWTFPDHIPFYTIKKWLDELKVTLRNDDFDSVYDQLYSLSIEALCSLILFPESIHISINDLAASSIEYAWRQFDIPIPWSTTIGYDTDNEVYASLLSRLEELREESQNDEK